MYEIRTQVRFSQCDECERLTAGALIDHFQDVVNAQAYGINVDSDHMTARGLAWILNAWNVEIKRFPKSFEQIRVSTWPYEFRGFFGMRNFKMEDEQGDVIAFADSIWTLMDIHTGHPVKVSSEIAANYQLEEPYAMEHANRKLSVDGEGELAGTVRIVKHHLDVNRHMNNAQYVREAADYLPDNFVITKIMVEYRKQTLLGEKMEFYKTIDKNCVTIVMKDSEGTVHAVAKFNGKTPEVELND